MIDAPSELVFLGYVGATAVAMIPIAYGFFFLNYHVTPKMLGRPSYLEMSGRDMLGRKMERKQYEKTEIAENGN